MAKPIQLPVHPELEDIGKAVIDLHECVEEHRAKTGKSFKTIQNQLRQSNREKKKIADKVDTIAQTVDTLQKTLIDKHKPLVLMGQREALGKVFLTVGAAMGAVSAVWKFAGFALPYGWHFLIALNNFYMGK